MNGKTECNPSTLRSSDAIHFETLKDTILSSGRIELSQRGSPYTVVIGAAPCLCSKKGCKNWVVSITRWNGVFSIQWIMSPEELEAFSSFNELREFVVLGGPTDSLGERQIIEREAHRVFGTNHNKVKPIPCACEKCMDTVGAEALWEKMLVSQLSITLREREAAIKDANAILGQNGGDFASRIFDLGYRAGRIFSEYKVKRFIEPDALAGQQYAELKAKREKAAGDKSAQTKQRRIEALLEQMEKIARENPIAARFGEAALAEVAVEEAKKRDPSLWVQGEKQVTEYIGRLRRGDEGTPMQDRYKAIFAKQPLKG